MSIREIKNSTKCLKQGRVSVLFVYMPGCRACEMAKAPFEQFSRTYKNIKYFKADINKIMELYIKFADKTEAYVPVVNENGETAKDESGNVITKLLLDEAGNPVMQPKIIAPMFFIFVKEEQSPENEYGWVGGIDGADVASLENVLKVLNNVEG
jgi:hypothetical protein